METEKILSWDVGIKNLAYCMLEKTENKFNILKWGTINLVDDRQHCEFIMQSGKQCEQNAKGQIYHLDKIPLFENSACKFGCNKHKSKLMPTLRRMSDLFKPKKKKKINKKKKTTKINDDGGDSGDNIIKIKCTFCDDLAKYKLTNTQYAWCDLHYEKKGKSFINKIKIKKVIMTNCTKQPLQILSEKMFVKLDEEFKDFMNVQKVLIENQPTFTNPTMKSISMFLHSYFVLRGIVDKKTTKSNIEEMRLISPSNKLKVNENNTNKVLKNETGKSTVYKLTKNLGVKYCKALINEKDIETLLKVKKKDDMCDAFLQGFQYLFNPIPEEYFNKLKVIGFENNIKHKNNDNDELFKMVKIYKHVKKHNIIINKEFVQIENKYNI